MNIPEKLATYSTQDTRQIINIREHRRGNQEMNNPETQTTYSTQDTGQINVREHRRGNQQ